MVIVSKNNFGVVDTGVGASSTKEIYEGGKKMIVKNQESPRGFWSVLDTVGTTIGNTIGQAVQGRADSFLNKSSKKFYPEPEKIIDTTGDPDDKPGNKKIEKIDNTNNYLLYGGGALAFITVLFLLNRN